MDSMACGTQYNGKIQILTLRRKFPKKNIFKNYSKIIIARSTDIFRKRKAPEFIILYDIIRIQYSFLS